LTFDPSEYCCSSVTGEPFPLPVKTRYAPYPPAARAVRATGEVTVDLKIKPDGTVEAATATGGHPLLRASARKAAQDSIFEMGPEGISREATLTYVFVEASSEESMFTRYSNPYRIVIIPESVQIN
jgi:TonB family protein